MKYDDEEVSVAADDLKDGRITIKRLKEDDELKGRLRYVGYTHWTQWAEYQHPV